MKAHEHDVFRFGSFVLVPSERLLLRRGENLALAGRPFDLLVELVRNAGHLVTKDELLERAWPGVVVEEVNLSVNVSALRKVLSLDPGGGEWIETVQRQGYRFNAPVTVADVATENLAQLRGLASSYHDEAAAGPRPASVRRRNALLLVAGVATLLAGGAWLGWEERRDRTAAAKRPTDNIQAYQAYVEGRFHWNQRSEAGLERAVESFQRAIELDPRFALAYAALADAHTARGYLGYVAPVATFPVARPFALKALELDPSLAQAHAALAYIKFYFDWDWEGARAEFEKAIALDPAAPVAHQWNAVYLLAAGRPAQAYREIETAQRLDPLSLAINTDIGFHHFYSGRYPEAIAQLRSVLGMKSDFALAHLWLSRSYVETGRYDEALAAAAAAEARVPEWPVLVAARGYIHGVAGHRDEARAVLLEMQELAKRKFVTAYGMALVHAGMGRKDDAFLWLDKAFEERSHWLVWLRIDARWKGLRDDPRFHALAARMKYPR